MKKVIMTCIALAFGSSAYAGSFNPALEDPVVTPPAQCLVLGIIPCHGPSRGTTMDGSDTISVTPGNPTKPTDPKDPDCEPKGKDKDKEPKGKDKDKEPKGKKGNASANNGKGGNYDKTGHSDNGKGQGRNKK